MLRLSKTIANSTTRKLYNRTAQHVVSPSGFVQHDINKRAFSQISTPEKSESKDNSLWERWFGKESTVAPASFKNRWAMVVPAIAGHMCIGSPYAWSLVADVITRENGFVASTGADWTLMETALPLSMVFLMHGLSATLLGKWQVKVGPRKSNMLAAITFGGALGLGALGIHYHCLPLLYLGYGFLGGVGMGFGYTPPVQTLMQWFPDKKGIASGITIAGFGSGALIFTPIFQSLMQKFSKLPDYLGPAENYVTKIMDGKLYADVNGQFIEVVQAGAAELAKIPFTLSEGLYVVGTGNTGAAAALATMGAAYFTVITASSLMIKNPHPSYVPEGMAAASPVTSTDNKQPATAIVKGPDMTVDEVMKTSQFPLLGLTFFCLASGGMGLFSVAKPMMSEVFSKVLPTVVTSAFATKFVLMVSGGNLAGRLAWGALSDKIGRKNTFAIFTLGSIPVYLSMPYLVESVVSSGSTVPLYLFCGATMAAVSGMGAAFAILPAYEADLFGTKYVSAVHGRMLMFSSCAGVVGPYMLLKLRGISEMNAINDLMTKVDPQKFESTFGASMDKAADLVSSKALNISKLLTLCPPGTLDPSPYLYNTTMYTLSGAMVVACVAHSFVKPTTPQATTVIDVKANESPASEPVAVVKEEPIGDRVIKK